MPISSSGVDLWGARPSMTALQSAKGVRPRRKRPLVPPWETEVYAQGDEVMQRQAGRETQTAANSLARQRMIFDLNSPGTMRESVASELSGMDFGVGPPVSMGRGTGLYDAGYSRPAWLQERLDANAQRLGKDRNWANSRHINNPLATVVEIPPPSPGEIPYKTLGGAQAGRARAFINNPQVQAHLAKSKEYRAKRDRGEDALGAGPLRAIHSQPLFADEDTINVFDKEMTYGDYKQGLAARLTEHTAKRRASRAGKQPLEVRKEMVSQRARGAGIDPEEALASVLQRQGAELPAWLVKRREDKRRAGQSPAALFSGATRYKADKESETALAEQKTGMAWLDRQAKSNERNALVNEIKTFSEGINAIADKKNPQYKTFQRGMYAAQEKLGALEAGGSEAPASLLSSPLTAKAGGFDSGTLPIFDRVSYSMAFDSGDPEAMLKFLDELKGRGVVISEREVNRILREMTKSSTASRKYPKGKSLWRRGMEYKDSVWPTVPLPRF